MGSEGVSDKRGHSRCNKNRKAIEAREGPGHLEYCRISEQWRLILEWGWRLVNHALAGIFKMAVLTRPKN